MAPTVWTMLVAVGCSTTAGDDTWPSITGSLPSGATYSFSLKGEPTDVDTAWTPEGDDTVSYGWSNDDEHMLVFVGTLPEEVRDDPAVDRLDEAAAVLFLLPLTLTIGALPTDEPAVSASGDTGPAGYELRFDSDEGPGVLRTVTDDLVVYAMISIDQSVDDTTRFFESFVFDQSSGEGSAGDGSAAGTAPPSDDADVTDDIQAQKVESVVGSDDAGDEPDQADTDDAAPFGPPPYGERPLLDGAPWSPVDHPAAAAGDRPYRDADGRYLLELIPPPTMAPPGTTPVLDDLWLACGLGADGAACDDLAAEAVFANNNLYRAFGLSCGGRTRVEVASCGDALSP